MSKKKNNRRQELNDSSKIRPFGDIDNTEAKTEEVFEEVSEIKTEETDFEKEVNERLDRIEKAMNEKPSEENDSDEGDAEEDLVEKFNETFPWDEDDDNSQTNEIEEQKIVEEPQVEVIGELEEKTEEIPLPLLPKLPEEEDEELEEPVKIIKEENKPNWLLLIIPFLLLLLFGWLLFSKGCSHKPTEQELQNEYETVKSTLNIEFDEALDTPIVEAGENLTITKNEEANVEMPDILKNYVVSIPEEATVKAELPNTKFLGETNITFVIEKEDKYGRTVTNTQLVPIVVEDNTAPEITLEADTITASDIAGVKANVKSVVDPVFGEYLYSENKEAGTWFLDGKIDFKKTGEYKVNVVVNDNGKKIEKPMTVKVKVEEKQEEKPEEKQEVTQATQTTPTITPTPKPTQKPTQTGPVYVFEDEEGNKYTQEEFDNLFADGDYELSD